jgi:hypothetical protein
VPGESEDPEEPPEGSEATEGSEEEPDTTPDEPDEPEPERDVVQGVMDFFKSGNGIWGGTQKDILYAMDGQDGSANIPGAIYALFDTYYRQASFTAQDLARIVSNSFEPAYKRVYEIFGELIHNNASDINAALGYGGWDANSIHIQEAKNLVAAYKDTVDQSIAPYLEDPTYNTYLELLTTELVNPKEGHNYFQDERIVGMDYGDPKVTLAFAHVAIEMINYMLAEL